MSDGREPGRRRVGGAADTTPSGSFGKISGGASSRGVSRAPAVGSGAPTPGAMRAARRRWATGVAVVTSVDGEGSARVFRGATVSSLTTVSVEPPLLLVCLDRDSAIGKLVAATGVFAVSILDRRHEFQADRFSGYGPQADPRFAGIAHTIGATGCPILLDALAWFDCRVFATHDGGDHAIVIGEAVGIGVGADTDDPLLNYEGAYRRIEGA
ncbi:MAG: flavin reductase family protein [Thermomicrobiales bacterium]